MVRREMWIFFTGLILVVTLVWAGNSPAKAQGSRMYTAAIEQIDQLIQSEMKKNNIQGLSVALVNEEGIFWSKGYGYADVKNKIKATPKTLYRIGSATKSFTATGVMLLVDRGLVKLDAPITEYIPEFSIQSIYPESREMTVRDLLNHHAGLKRDYYKQIKGKNPPDLDYLVQELQADGLALPPGRLYKYSNIGYALLGKIIENVSGKSYEQFMEEDLFNPLGMSHSDPKLTTINADQISKAYSIEGLIFKKKVEIEQLRLRDLPAGSIVSSVEDVAKFIQFIFNDGKNTTGDQLLSKDLLEQMFVIQYPENELDEDPYGLGWKVNKSHIPYTIFNLRHGGTIDGFSSLMVAAPAEKLGIVLSYNTGHIFSRHYIANEALEMLAKAKQEHLLKTGDHGPTGQKDKQGEKGPYEKRIALQGNEYQQYLGRYVGIGDLPLVIDLVSKKDELKLVLTGMELSLEPVSTTRYRVVKDILWLKIGVGQFMGVDDTYFDLYQGEDGTIYPRLILKYEDLEMKILFEQVEPYELSLEMAALVGEYVPTAESRLHTDEDSFAEFALVLQEGWLVMQTKWEGETLELLLKPVSETELITYGSGEMVRIYGDQINFSGIYFERK